MKTDPRITRPLIFALLLAAACSEARPPKSEAIERAKTSPSILTSTLPAAEPDPTEEKEPAAPLAAIVEAPPSESPAAEERRIFEPELTNFDGLALHRLVTAPEVEGREPVAASSLFGPQNERVYAFVEVSNQSDEDRTLLVHFIGPEGQVSGGVELHIPASAPRWRTWAYTGHATTPGLWRVEIRIEDGTLVGALPFEVETGC